MNSVTFSSVLKINHQSLRHQNELKNKTSSLCVLLSKSSETHQPNIYSSILLCIALVFGVNSLVLHNHQPH